MCTALLLIVIFLYLEVLKLFAAQGYRMDGRTDKAATIHFA